MLPYFSAVMPEFFCCLRISAFNLSSTCLLASLITSFLKSSQVNSSNKDSRPPNILSIVLLLTVDWCNFDTSVLTGNALS